MQTCSFTNIFTLVLVHLRSCKTVLQCKSMCVCWVSVDCEEPEPVTIKESVTEASHDYKEEVNYQNAVSIH